MTGEIAQVLPIFLLLFFFVLCNNCSPTPKDYCQDVQQPLASQIFVRHPPNTVKMQPHLCENRTKPDVLSWKSQTEPPQPLRSINKRYSLDTLIT